MALTMSPRVAGSLYLLEKNILPPGSFALSVALIAISSGSSPKPKYSAPLINVVKAEGSPVSSWILALQLSRKAHAATLAVPRPIDGESSYPLAQYLPAHCLSDKSSPVGLFGIVPADQAHALVLWYCQVSLTH